MSVEGSLSYMDIAHLLKMVGTSRKSGMLTIRCEVREARLFFDRGHLIRASSNQIRDGIGSLLVEAGHLAAEDLDRALEVQRRYPGFALPGQSDRSRLRAVDSQGQALAIDWRITVLELDAEPIYRSFAHKVRELAAGRDLRLVGVHTGGVWLAQRLKDDLHVTHEVGILDISFYRDDFSRSGLNPSVKPSSIALDVEGADIVLVDDVLYTGRTVRAAMNELFDYGRPARIDLAVLIDRGGRELPVQPTVDGRRIEVPEEISVVLSRDDDGRLHLTLEQRREA